MILLESSVIFYYGQELWDALEGRVGIYTGL